LSLEPNIEGRPWFAYRQFCEHFLVPLLLMSRVDVRCGTLLHHYLEGVPLDLGSALLPRRTWASPSVLLHVHLHARAQKKYQDAEVASVARGRAVSSNALRALASSLRSVIASLDWEPTGTTWADYATDDSYSDEAARSKERIVADFLERVDARVVWDAGANTGAYSRLAAGRASLVVSLDVDAAAVERNYRRVREHDNVHILPLCMDLMNPSPARGWAHRERLSLEERGPADAVLALALVHHLAIARNVPLPRIAEHLARLGRALIIEFVPKPDAQVARMLRNRPDIFPGYTREGFEAAFASHFEILAAEPVADSARRIYLMTNRQAPATHDHPFTNSWSFSR
ncbi:MAG: class I SAM-dependent methyltransferase, partial [Longimicrobiales bacterium]